MKRVDGVAKRCEKPPVNEFQVSRSVHPVIHKPELEKSPELLTFDRPSKPMVAGSNPAGIAKYRVYGPVRNCCQCSRSHALAASAGRKTF